MRWGTVPACTRGTGSHEGLGAYRGHYISGLYTTAGYGIIFLMQAPDWLPARLRVNGSVVNPVKVRRTLDMRAGEDVSIAPGRVASFPVRRAWLPQAVEGVVFDTGVIGRMQDPLKTLNALMSAGLKIGIVELTKEEIIPRSKSYPAGITCVDESILWVLPPDPQAYYVAAQRMRCIQWNCIAVVGSDQHCASAREAGMVTVSVGNGSMEAFAVIDSENELVFSALASIFALREKPGQGTYRGSRKGVVHIFAGHVRSFHLIMHWKWGVGRHAD